MLVTPYFGSRWRRARRRSGRRRSRARSRSRSRRPRSPGGSRRVASRRRCRRPTARRRRSRPRAAASLTMSASASRPPGRNARAAAANTAGLSGDRLITPFEITQSKVGVLDRGLLDVAGAELGLCGSRSRRRGAVPWRAALGHVDADDAALRAGRQRGEEAVGAGAAAEVEHGLARRDGGEVEEVADAGERLDRGRPGSRRARPSGSRAARRAVGRSRSGTRVRARARPPGTCA